MLQDRIYVPLRAHALLGVFNQQAPYEIFALVAHMDVVLLGVWKRHWFYFYRLVYLLTISSHERRESNHHFVRENPEAPPVDHR